MSAALSEMLPANAVGLRLARIAGDELILCESIRFGAGRAGVLTVLTRASISGLVEVNGELQSHFVDVLDESGDIVETVALDRFSYKALKGQWMRCRVERG
ncbi:hypothetical protein SAMN05421819_3546 [Bryocella elongata]|uniref:Uncharacterized protein n=1 Tax=Bryocella elongata TaxID=863522 RepID=A0A1H6B7M1_9BACT|nr:hypothetical protein [Bryocella elongata]SEG56126.1 hypothetical protein SAMN05421819_3546 [Bryocella elongata]